MFVLLLLHAWCTIPWRDQQHTQLIHCRPAKIAGVTRVWQLFTAGKGSRMWRAGVLGAEETAAEGDEVEEDRETLHRLCPTYAQDINSPLRHVRTRIYFTSESHMHSLINVLRYSHLCKLR